MQVNITIFKAKGSFDRIIKAKILKIILSNNEDVIVDKLWELDIDTIFFRAAYPSFLLNQMDKYSYNKNNSIKFTRMLSNNTQTYGLYKKIEENKFLKESNNNIIYLKIDNSPLFKFCTRNFKTNKTNICAINGDKEDNQNNDMFEDLKHGMYDWK